MPTLNGNACALPKVKKELAAADHEQGLRGSIRAQLESSVAAQGKITHESEAYVNIGPARVTRSTLQADAFASVLARIQNPRAVCGIENEAAFVGRHDLEQEFDARVAARTKAELIAAAGVTLADGVVDVQPAQAPRPATAPCAPKAQRPLVEFEIVQEGR